MIEIQTSALVRGDWRVRAFGPVIVSDPEKLYKLSPPELRAAFASRPEIIPCSVARQLERMASRSARRELTRLLSGAPELWQEDFMNLVVNQGLDDLLDITLSGGTQDSTWFLGLTDGTPTVAAGDTPASHAGWAEVTVYDEASRPAWTDGGVSGQSISNSASPATFTISANGTTVGGAGLFGDNTKGGSTGRLYAAGAFTAGDKLLDDNDTLDVTATFTMAAA